MIVVFPLLTDESISQNIMPALCKSIEKFLLVYHMDDISRMLGMHIITLGGTLAGAAIQSAATKMKQQNESLDFINEAYPEDDTYYDDKNVEVQKSKYVELGKKPPKPHSSYEEDAYEQNKRYKSGYKRSQDEINRQDEMRRSVGAIRDTIKDLRDIGTTQFLFSRDINSLSLEPTWVSANTSFGTKIIGIKVIPIAVKNSKGLSLAEMMASDLSLDYWNGKLISYKRKIIRVFWAICRGVRIIPFLTKMGNQPITGDPEKDILFASTFHKSHVFCMLNFSDITSSEFFKNAGGIHKLHSLGWNSIIAADDVNKRVIWCMKQFHGLCSSTQYSFIASSFGKENARAYTDMETVKRTASSIFAKSTFSINKLFNESKELNNYLKGLK
jgi:hypothetical protein